MVSGPRIESKEVYPLDFLLLIVFLSTLSDNIVLSLFWMEYHQVYMCVNTSNAIALPDGRYLGLEWVDILIFATI